MLYCDLIGSTALFAELDPEEVGEVLKTYHQRCADCIDAVGGFVAQFQGDGVIGFFGYAQAAENDAERAVRAALELVKQIPRLRAVEGRTLDIRIGIGTGLAIVGDTLREGTRLEQGAVGEVLHLAARLQASALANEILVAESTRRLTGRLFDWQSKGRLDLKGFADPVAVSKVVGLRPITNRSGMKREPLLIQLVSRQAELERLMQAWRQATAGSGQIVNVVGAAGIGKSRLLYEFRRKIGRGRHIWIEGGGAQFFANTPFYVVSQLIRRALDPRGRSSPEGFRERLKVAFAEWGVDAGEEFRLVVEMMGEPATGASIAVTVEERNRLLAALADWLVATARRRPLIVVVEDLHWLDPSSLEVDDFIADKIGASPILMLRTTRPGFNPTPTAKRVSSQQLLLQPLDDSDLRQVVLSASGAAALSERVIDQILQRAEGVPLFGIELARLVGARQASVGDHEIPATLADLLAARLDQLETAKEIAQIAAVLGDEITSPMLQAMSDAPPARLQAQLAELWRHDVLEQDGNYLEPVYVFTHALLRDAAYSSLLKGRRQKLHRQVASVLIDKFPDKAAARPELVAHHWTQAGDWEKAFAAWRKAGDFASARRGFREAELAYQSAVSALVVLPESPERDENELGVQSALADVLRITRGFSASRTKEVTARAGALAERRGDRPQQFRQMWGSWTAASSGGDFSAASRVANQFYKLAIADGTANDLAHAYMIQMTSKYRTGDLLGAEEHFKKGEKFFGLTDFQRRPGVIAQTYGNASQIAWTLGDNFAARDRINHAMSIADENDNPFDHAYAEHMAANYKILIEEYSEAEELARRSIELSDKHSFPQFGNISRVVLGRARAGLGAIDEGTRILQDGLSRMAASAQRVSITKYFTWLAETLCLAKSFYQALGAVDEALAVNPQELFFRPETVRLRGEIALKLDRAGEAEEAFLEAIALSKQMGSSRFGERATRSLEGLRRNDRGA